MPSLENWDGGLKSLLCTGAGRSTCGGTMKFNRFHSWEV